MPDQTMNPAERYAALKMLEHGLKAVLSTAAAEADEWRQQTRSKQLETDWGLVSLTRRKPSIAITDTAALVAWCEEHQPDLVEKTVPTTAVTWLKANRWDDTSGDVVDRESGELLDFAEVREGSESLMVRLTPEAKDLAVESVAERLEALTAAMVPALDEPEPEPEPVVAEEAPEPESRPKLEPAGHIPLMDAIAAGILAVADLCRDSGIQPWGMEAQCLLGGKKQTLEDAYARAHVLTWIRTHLAEEHADEVVPV